MSSRPAGRAAIGLLALVALSVVLRTQRMDVGFWIDEALSVGIADRPLTDIPGTLRLDGSPPLYYLLLHGWMRLAGTGEGATHALSLLFATASVPVAWSLVRPLAGERAAWVAAALLAANPFLTHYAQETRMYALVVLLGVVAATTFAGAFVLRRGRGWTLGFAASLTALLYTHNWALFLAAACGLAWLVLCLAGRDRPLVRSGALAFGSVAALYAFWVPSLVFQAEHTGAPWSRVPGLGHLADVPVRLLGGAPAAVLAVVAGAGAATLLRRPRGASGRILLSLGSIAAGTVLLAWLSSQVSPAWASRYLAVVAAPALIAGALGVAAAGRVGLAGLAVVLGIWAAQPGPSTKSNVRELSAAIGGSLGPGDLVVATQPEQVPALAYYLRIPGLRWATLTGAVRDTGVTDWRDGVERLERASPARDLVPLLAGMPPGSRVAVVEPQIGDPERWTAPWTRLVRHRGGEWTAAMRADPRFRVMAVRPVTEQPTEPNQLRASVFVRRGIR